MLVDLVFVLDMVATFRTAYYRNYESELITDNKLIAKRYLATWFSVDLVSAGMFTSIVVHIQLPSASPMLRFPFVWSWQCHGTGLCPSSQVPTPCRCGR